MGMYHKNHLVGPGFKRMAKRQTSKGMRRAAKKSCQELFEDSITLTRKSHNLHGIDAGTKSYLILFTLFLYSGYCFFGIQIPGTRNSTILPDPSSRMH